MIYIFQQLYQVPCKVQLSMKLRFVKTDLDEDNNPITLTKFVITNEKQSRVFNDVGTQDYMQMAFDRFDKFINDWSEHGSGWQLEEIVNMNIRVSLVKIICGSGTVKLPPVLLGKKAVLNIDSPDGQCFQYAVVAALHHTDSAVNSRHKNHASNYTKFLHYYNFSCFNGPVDASELKQFEKLNPNVSLTAIIWEKDKPRMCYTTHNTNGKIAIILFYAGHWLPVMSLGRLLGSADVNSAYCHKCLGNFYKPEKLEKHIPKCLGQQETMPSDKIFKWDDMKKSLPPPYVLYCDIESLLQKTHVPGIIHEHVPISVGCILVPNGELKSSPIADANQIKIFTGTDCMTKFVNYIHQLQSQLFEWCHDKCKVPIDFTIQQRCSTCKC